MIHEKTKGEAIVVTDVGQHQMWAAQYYRFNKADRWVTSGGLRYDGIWSPCKYWCTNCRSRCRQLLRLSVMVDSKCLFKNLLVINELNFQLKLLSLIISPLGMVRQWQELFYE